MERACQVSSATWEEVAEAMGEATRVAATVGTPGAVVAMEVAVTAVAMAADTQTQDIQVEAPAAEDTPVDMEDTALEV